MHQVQFSWDILNIHSKGSRVWSLLVFKMAFIGQDIWSSLAIVSMCASSTTQFKIMFGIIEQREIKNEYWVA